MKNYFRPNVVQEVSNGSYIREISLPPMHLIFGMSSPGHRMHVSAKLDQSTAQMGADETAGARDQYFAADELLLMIRHDSNLIAAAPDRTA